MGSRSTGELEITINQCLAVRFQDADMKAPEKKFLLVQILD